MLYVSYMLSSRLEAGPRGRSALLWADWCPEHVWNDGKDIWNTYGKHMENIYGTYMEHIWNTYGTHMENIWKTYGKTDHVSWFVFFLNFTTWLIQCQDSDSGRPAARAYGMMPARRLVPVISVISVILISRHIKAYQGISRHIPIPCKALSFWKLFCSKKTDPLLLQRQHSSGTKPAVP